MTPPTFTVDASVWVNGFDQREPGHKASRSFLEFLRIQNSEIIVPNLLLIEVGSAISRTRNQPQAATELVEALGQIPNLTLVPLDDALAEVAQDLAIRHRLRGADAVYGAVALRAGSTLVSLDREHLERLTGIVPTKSPEQALHSF